MAKTDITAINAKTISVNGVPVAGSGLPTGPVTTFDQIDADTVLALNGAPLFGTLPPGVQFTNFSDLNVTSGVSVAETVQYGVAAGGTAPVIPAPVFTTAPSISPASGTAGSTTFTANDGAASNATGFTRRWLLSGTAIGTGTTVLPGSAGSLVLEVTATGPSGSTVATSAAVTVAAAAALALTGPLAFTAGAAAGTLVANIGNVPSGVTPTLTPNDGRLAIGGDQSSGWKVVVGLSASTAGAIALTVAATGATSASATVTISAAVSPPAGFAMNGSTNPALKAMLSRVAAGTGRGLIDVKGDSTGAGVGGSIDTGTGTSAQQFTGARPFRPSAVIASQLSSVGYAALDNAFVADNGIVASSTAITLPAYDARVAYPTTAWVVAGGGQAFAGGGFLNGNGKGPIEFTPATAVNTFKIVVFNSGSTHTVLIDGASPASITAPGATIAGNAVTPPSTNSGFTTITVTAASAGTHTVRVTPSGTGPLLRSIMAYNSAAAAIDILNHAAASATSANQAATGSNWSNNDALGYDAPDLTIINLGLNDATTNVTASVYTTNLQAIITKAKLSGDVLLMSPHPASPSFAADAKQVELRNAASSLAASNNVAYLDLYTYFGSWAAVSSRTADNLVHPNKGMYAEIGQVMRQAIQAMAA